MNYESILAATPKPVLVTGGVLAVLVLIFFVFFLAPGALHWFRLSSILRRIKKFESKKFASEFKKIFAKDKRLSRLWKEYSLHIQREQRDGELMTVGGCQGSCRLRG